MPGFDGTGPRGQGPMTGGGRGYCAVPAGEAVRGFGRGMCGGRGGGRGWRKAQRGMQAAGGYGRALPREEELAMLKSQAEELKNELDAVQARVQELETK